MEITLHDEIVKSKDEFSTVNFIIKPKALYSYLTSLNKLKSKPDYIIQDGQSITDPYQRALCFNNYFHSTFTDSSLSLPSMSSLSAPSSIDRIELSPTKAKGCDQLHPMILKLCADSLMHPLHQLFTASLSDGILPSQWKTHRICPIAKSGNPLHVTIQINF
jgi:hypothetical protein